MKVLVGYWYLFYIGFVTIQDIPPTIHKTAHYMCFLASYEANFSYYFKKISLQFGGIGYDDK